MDHELIDRMVVGMGAWLRSGALDGPPDVVTLASLIACTEAAQYADTHFRKAALWRENILTQAMRHAGVQDGLVLEFGVCSGTTISEIAKSHKGPVHGFDSFTGLPEDWMWHAPAGFFSRQGAIPAGLPANVELHVGWFQDTLPGFMASHPGPVRFAHIDCDLYSSTMTVFEHIAPRLVDGSILVFDEYLNYPGWKASEYKAWQEIVATHGLAYEYIGHDGLHRVAVRVER